MFVFQLGGGEVIFDPDGQYVDGTTPNSMTAYTEFKTAINADAIDPSMDATHYRVAFPGDPEFLAGDATTGTRTVTEGGTTPELTVSGDANSIVVFDSDDGAGGLTFTARHGNAPTDR